MTRQTVTHDETTAEADDGATPAASAIEANGLRLVYGDGTEAVADVSMRIPQEIGRASCRERVYTKV